MVDIGLNPVYLQQIINEDTDNNDDDDFVDTLKGTISVWLITAIFWLIAAIIIVRLAENANVATVELNKGARERKMKLIKTTWDYWEKNGFVNQGFYPF